MSLTYKNIIKNFFIYSGGAIFLKMAQAIVIPLNLKVISPTQYGILALANGFSTIVAIFLGLGLRQALWLDFFHHDNDNRKKILADIITVYLTTSSPIFFILILSIPVINKVYFLNSANFSLILIAILTCFLSFFGELFFQILRYQSRAYYCTFVQILSAIFSIILNLCLVLYFQLNIMGVALANLSSLLIPAVFGFHEYLKLKINFLTKINSGLIKKYLSLGAPFIPGMIFAWILSSCDKIILSRFCSMHEVGIYSLTDTLGQIFNLIILQPLSGSYLPALFESYSQNKHNILPIEQKNRNFMWISMLGMFFLISAGFIVAKKVLLLILPIHYHQVTNYLWLMLVGYIFLMGTYFSCSYIQFKKKTKFLSLSFCIPAIFNILLNLLFVPRFGAYGSVASTTLSYLIYFLITLAYNRHILQKDISPETSQC